MKYSTNVIISEVSREEGHTRPSFYEYASLYKCNIGLGNEGVGFFMKLKLILKKRVENSRRKGELIASERNQTKANDTKLAYTGEQYC